MTLVLGAWAIAAALQLVLWLVQLRTRNAGIVDVGWALSFAFAVALFAWRAETPARAWLPIAVVVVAWSVRLTLYLVVRGAARAPEDGRYAELRTRWRQWHFFVFFQAQAALTGLLATAFVVPFVEMPASELRWIGTAISVVGIAGEAIADAQLARFKRTQHGVCDVGLWAYSRHPNYFFEWVYWVGLAVYGLAFAPEGLIAVVGQAIILGSILGVTGIPPTETQALRSKGVAYRQYQARVSRFIPLPPKRTRPSI